MTRFWIGVGAVVLLSMFSLWYGLSKYAKFDLNEVSDADLATRYRLVCGAYGEARLDEARIPPQLHPLIPLARRYGRSDRVMLDDCAAKMSAEDAADFVRLVGPNVPEIHRWIDRFPQNFWADEVYAFRALLELRDRLKPVRVDSEKSIS